MFNKGSTALKVQEGADQMSAAVSIVRADGEGERLRFWGGGVMTMKATAEETGGAFLLFEDLMAQGKTTPLHLHANEDEAPVRARGRAPGAPRRERVSHRP